MMCSLVGLLVNVNVHTKFEVPTTQLHPGQRYDWILTI